MALKIYKMDPRLHDKLLLFLSINQPHWFSAQKLNEACSKGAKLSKRKLNEAHG